MSARHHTGRHHRRLHRDLGRSQRHRPDTSAAERIVRSLRSAKVISTRLLREGLVVIARIPYAESADYKVRPAVVVAASDSTVTLRPISSSERLAALRGGERMVRHGRRCWVLDYTVAVDAIDIVAIEGPLAA